MEDNFLDGMKKWMETTQNEVENLKNITDVKYESLNEDQKKELDKAVGGLDMKSLNSVVEESSANIIKHINSMFK